jgi:uncharacterized protein
MIEISKVEARQIALNSQLFKTDKGLNSKDSIMSIFHRLGYVQIDTISVIKRAHHHTIWSRFKAYKPEDLDELQSVDKQIFEYWGHAASYLPMEDYRFYLPLMQAFVDPHRKWEKDRLQKFGHLMPVVLERIQEEGGLCSKDFKDDLQKKKGTWWEWRPAKVALELLYYQGELMISCRKGFRKYYDLTERVLPEHVNLEYPSEKAVGYFAVLRALRAQGISRASDIRDHIHVAGKDIIALSLLELEEDKQIEKVQIEGDKKNVFYSLPGINNLYKAMNDDLYILSPFDNFVINRERIELLFDFDYKLECYVPASKRKYGYFVLPLVFRNNLVGRVDIKADRKKKKLIVKDLYFENNFVRSVEFDMIYEKKLNDFAEFNGCEFIGCTQ